jgi:hypothetical protein
LGRLIRRAARTCCYDYVFFLLANRIGTQTERCQARGRDGGLDLDCRQGTTVGNGRPVTRTLIATKSRWCETRSAQLVSRFLDEVRHLSGV